MSKSDKEDVRPRHHHWERITHHALSGKDYEDVGISTGKRKSRKDTTRIHHGG